MHTSRVKSTEMVLMKQVLIGMSNAILKSNIALSDHKPAQEYWIYNAHTAMHAMY